MEKHSIVYIIPYFGRFRKDFDLWLRTSGYNPTIDFLIFTDDRNDHSYPPNVNVVYMDYSIFRSYINDKMGFEVMLDRPYKLCDLKPAYGYLFQEYISQYEFWGHCDMDLLWGNIREFITDDVLDGYDIIGFLGHSTIYRNTEEVNRRFMLKANKYDFDYKLVFTTDKEYHFDEDYINYVYKENRWKTWEEVVFADLTEYHYNFFLTNVRKEMNHSRQIFEWKNGLLQRHYIDKGALYHDKFMYIHFLRRDMDLQVNDVNSFSRLVIYPNTITDNNIAINTKFVYKKGNPRWFTYFWNLYKTKKDTITLKNLPGRIINRINKYILLLTNNESLNEKENYKI